MSISDALFDDKNNVVRQLPIEKLDKKCVKTVVLETVKYLTRIGNQDTWYTQRTVAKVIESFNYKVEHDDYLKRHLEELANEGELISTTLKYPYNDLLIEAYRAKL